MKKERKLYKIGQLSDFLGITQRTIRYYDQYGLLPYVKRSQGGVRLFDDADIMIITKVRQMQKNTDFSLDKIREELFKESESNTQKIAIVTDSTAILSGTYSEHQLIYQTTPISQSNLDIWENKEMLFNASSTVEQIRSLYESLISQGFQKIFSVHTGSYYSTDYAIAKQASQGLPVQVVDSYSFGAGLGLLVEQIAHGIIKKESNTQLELLISKQVPLIYQIGFFDQSQYLLLGNHHIKRNAIQNELAHSFFNFKPVFICRDAKQKICIENCFSTKVAALEFIQEMVQLEFALRVRYINRILISYYHLSEDAEALFSYIRQVFPHTQLNLVKMSDAASIEIGPKAITLSII